MIARNPYSNCMDARVYYYDFLREETKQGIPEGALEHMIQCDDCRLEIERLRAVFERLDKKINGVQSRKNTALATLLKLHFAYIGEPVTCETVKPFLPSMADPALQIRTPTPITAHIDRCRTCSEDLTTLRNLQLTHKQLCHLGQLMADEATNDNVSCKQSRAAIASVASMAHGETKAEILKHLCTCPECRQQLRLCRETLRNKLPEDGLSRNDLPCESISAADIFDYCLPYGLDPADDQYAGFRESIVSHLRDCPTCTAKIQDLHNTICDILERPASEVATIYNITEQTAEELPISESDEPYPGFPVKVELINLRERAIRNQPAAIINFSTRLKQRTLALTAKPQFKAIAIAAALVIGLSMLLSLPTATAVTYDQMSRAVKDIRNVHITNLSREGETNQEIWVSRPNGIYMIKTGQDTVFYDITNKVRKAKLIGGDSVEQTMLPDEDCAAIKNRINSSLGLLPFERMSNVPQGTTWSRVSSDSLGMTDDNIEVYDLTHPAPSLTGSGVFSKDRFFVDTQTGLPSKIEFYRKHPTDSEYILRSELIVDQLTNAQFQDIVESASF